MRVKLIFMIAGLVLAVTLVMMAYGTPKTNRVSIHYITPKNPSHQAIYTQMKQRGALEELQTFLSPFLLPRTLRISMKECDGEADAWYDFVSITICYELIADLWENMAKETSVADVEPIDTVIGPLVEISLHEVAHALFDLLGLPILGREEDAADQVAAYILLQLGDTRARRMITGAAFAYRTDELRSGHCRSFEDYAGEHSTPAQRAFNTLCIAYGADRKLFADFVSEGYLPEERAEFCYEEYEKAQYAFELLIQPHIDKELADQTYGRPWLCEGQDDSASVKYKDCLLAPPE
jgi:hypothetical protein